MLGDVLDSITGRSGRRAAVESGRVQARNYREAMDLLRETFGRAEAQLTPYSEAGLAALPFLLESISPEGMDQILSEIMGGDAYSELLAERELGAESMLSAGGLTRSGTAARDGADIRSDLANQLFGQLYGANTGLAGMGSEAASNIAQLQSNLGTSLANLQGLQGNALAGGILGGAQAEQQGFMNLFNIGATIADYFRPPGR